jgi:polyhydroxybutyrate depolymerase
LVSALGQQLGPGDHTRTLSVDGRSRSYVVHVPPSYDGSEPAPVVLAFHGGLDSAVKMIRFSCLSDKADEVGFLAVYPNGTGRRGRFLTWNAGNCCGPAMRNNVDDVAFARALIDDLGRLASIDPKRIYATGMSNGGMLAYRLASELSDRIAAIASVAGPMGTETCSPARPVPVMHFHGTRDRSAPFEGGVGIVTHTHFYSVDHSVMAWVRANGCPEEPVVDQLPDEVADGTSVIRKTYGPGSGGSEVILVVIRGGGHTWPGRQPPSRWLSRLLGPSTRDISANDMMWEFFKRHPMP